MKIELLPSSFDEHGLPSQRQHLACLVVNDRVAVDAGSLAFSISDAQRAQIRDVVLTHAHLDHIAGLPLFIDDLFASLDSPVRVHASAKVVEILERDIFNWSIYPKFSELANENGPVIEYITFEDEREFSIGELTFCPIAVNHKVPASGFIIRDAGSTVAISGDTAAMDKFWERVNVESSLKAVVIECAFPNELVRIAERSSHMTPCLLEAEMKKLRAGDCAVYVTNIKPMYREAVIEQLSKAGIPNLNILEVGRAYDW